MTVGSRFPYLTSWGCPRFRLRDVGGSLRVKGDGSSLNAPYLYSCHFKAVSSSTRMTRHETTDLVTPSSLMQTYTIICQGHLICAIINSASLSTIIFRVLPISAMIMCQPYYPIPPGDELSPTIRNNGDERGKLFRFTVELLVTDDEILVVIIAEGAEDDDRPAIGDFSIQGRSELCHRIWRPGHCR